MGRQGFVLVVNGRLLPYAGAPPPGASLHHTTMSHHSSTLPALIRQRRYWVALVLLWAGVVVLALRAHVADLREQSIQVATEGARNVFRMVMLTRSWNEQHGGVYVAAAPVAAAPRGPMPRQTSSSRKHSHGSARHI